MDISFARTIRKLRTLKDWSVYDLAKRLRNERGNPMTAGYISKVEARGEIPSPDMIIQLEEVLGVKPEKLMAIAKAEKTKEVSKAVQKKYDDSMTLYRKTKKG